jgi:hypothetical protein
VWALEDKIYGVELNHVPRKYNEGADEVGKITSGRISIPPNVFEHDIAKPYVNLGKTLPSLGEPSGELMEEDPLNEAYVLSQLVGYRADEAEAMKVDTTLHTADWRSKYLDWIDRSARGEVHRHKGQIVHRCQR